MKQGLSKGYFRTVFGESWERWSKHWPFNVKWDYFLINMKGIV